MLETTSSPDRTRRAEVIQARVTMAVELLAARRPNLFFRRAEGLQLVGPFPGARFIRFDNGRGCALKLAAIRIEAQDGTVLRAIKPVRHKQAVLDVHLDGTADPARILVKNRGVDLGAGAWALTISISQDGVEWTKIFDHGELEAEFVQQLASRRNELRVDYRELASVVDTVVLLLMRCNYKTARKTLRKSALDAQERRMLVQLVNEHVLKADSKEWTTHGVKSSFRFWSLKEKRAYIGFANQIIADLADLTPNVCFGFGSVLAIVRDGDLIPHDDDLDIIVVLPPHTVSGLQGALKVVAQHLSAKGYMVTGKFISHRQVKRGKFYKVDVFVGLEEDGALSVYPSPRRFIETHHVFPPREASILGVSCLIPGNAELYLERVYGADWRVPRPEFRHTWRRTEYTEIV